jgi:hypothetical protein
MPKSSLAYLSYKKGKKTGRGEKALLPVLKGEKCTEYIR